MPATPARLFVIAAPSGAGKTTLVHAITKRNPELRFSISYTTRTQRRTEVDGRESDNEAIVICIAVVSTHISTD